MKRLIRKHGPCPLAAREFEPFHMLANSIISQHARLSLPPVLESTINLDEPFAPHPDYVVDEGARTISIPIPAGRLFLRLENCRQHQILATEFEEGRWIIHYGP